MNWMTARATKPKCVLLDADIIIDAYQLGVWQKLTEQFELLVPSIVIHDEALFFSHRTGGQHEDINLRSQVADAKITELTATSEELASIFGIFDRVFIETLHPGETEALALLKANRAGEACFCTGDGCAIQALAMIGMSERGISMEKLLASIGLRKSLKRQLTENFFKQHRTTGQEKRITCEGLRCFVEDK